MTRLRVLVPILLLVALTACEGEGKAIQQDLPATRTTKARADAQQIARAVQLYQATFGTLPPSLEALTRAETVGGVRGGPFLAPIPAPPPGWTPYRYEKQGESRFTVTTSAGRITVTAP